MFTISWPVTTRWRCSWAQRAVLAYSPKDRIYKSDKSIAVYHRDPRPYQPATAVFLTPCKPFGLNHALLETRLAKFEGAARGVRDRRGGSTDSSMGVIATAPATDRHGRLPLLSGCRIGDIQLPERKITTFRCPMTDPAFCRKHREHESSRRKEEGAGFVTQNKKNIGTCVLLPSYCCSSRGACRLSLMRTSKCMICFRIAPKLLFWESNPPNETRCFLSAFNEQKGDEADGETLHAYLLPILIFLTPLSKSQCVLSS